MLEVIQLSLKNIWQDKRKSVPVSLSVLLACASLHIFWGYILATFDGLKFSTIFGGIGHIQIAMEDQFSQFSEDTIVSGIGIEDQELILKVIDKYEKVDKVVSRVAVQGLIGTDDQTLTFSGFGMELEEETGLFRALNPIVKGQGLTTFNPNESNRRIVLGQLLSSQLDVNPGDGVTLLAATQDGGINAIDFTVAGSTATGVPQTDSIIITVSSSAAKELQRTDNVSKYVVYLRDDKNIESVMKRLANDLPDKIKSKSWKEISVFYNQLTRMFYTQFFIFGFVICITVAVSILSAVVTSVLERTYEIGTMRAIGMSASTIRIIFMVETIIVGIVGAILGLIFSLITSVAISTSKIMVPPPPGRNQPVPLSILWDGLAGTVISLVVVGLCVASAMYASQRIMKMDVIDAIRQG